jgi:hypothetical protein
MDEQVSFNSGTPERIAFELWSDMRNELPHEKKGAELVAQKLAFFAQCLKAAKGELIDAGKLT